MNSLSIKLVNERHIIYYLYFFFSFDIGKCYGQYIYFARVFLGTRKRKIIRAYSSETRMSWKYLDRYSRNVLQGTKYSENILRE